MGEQPALWAAPDPSQIAQFNLPQRQDRHVADYAGVIPGTEEEALRERLQSLQSERGIEGVVLTVDSLGSYGADDIGLETFATRVYNEWGIDDRSTNDGFLILLVVDDRLVRVELGAAYGRRHNSAMQEVVDSQMLPWFRDGEYSRGLREGTEGVVESLTQRGGFWNGLMQNRLVQGLVAGAALFTALWRRFNYYVLQGGCLHELRGFLFSAVTGAIIGGAVGSLLGMAGFTMDTAQESVMRAFDILESGQYVQRFSLFAPGTLIGAGIGSALFVVSRLLTPGRRYQQMYGDGNGGGGSSGGGGASGSW